MGKYQGVKEKLHYPIYDAFLVPDDKTFGEVMTDPRMIRFFVDVQNKTRLETNLQASGVLPSLNTFEARAMRVVVSSPVEMFSDEELQESTRDYLAVLEQESSTEDKIQKAQKQLSRQIQAQFDRACQEANLFLADLIYRSVTSLLVGEKIMIEAPTFYFPGGAGVHPGKGIVSNHGEPDPMATFRFAEPVTIEPQQNFRVEMLFPQDVPDEVLEALGPIRIWVMLDGYLTRDVQ
jgi:hypothetical protein